MNQVKVGVIGVGTMGRRHYRVYSNLRHVQLAGVFDASAEAERQVTQEYGGVAYERIDDLLDNVDAVSLAVPTPLHFDLAMHCLERGVHVLVEKPITETLAQAEALTQAAEDSGLVVQVGHIERFNPAYMELKNVMQHLTALAVNMRRLSAFQGSNTDVDVVLDLMIHDIDLACDLVGQDPTAVDAYGLTAFSGVLDHTVAHLGFAEGPLVTMTASRVTEQKVRGIDVTALEAYVEADLLNKTILVHRRTVGEYLSHNHQGIKYRQESIVERIHVPIFEPLFLELQHFVACVQEHRPPLVPARDGLRALRLATTIREATSDSYIDAQRAIESQDRIVEFA
jgi:predicted dehydrogenase